MFSILEPGKHIPYHRGFYKGIYHYRLKTAVKKSGLQGSPKMVENPLAVVDN